MVMFFQLILICIGGFLLFLVWYVLRGRTPNPVYTLERNTTESRSVNDYPIEIFYRREVFPMDAPLHTRLLHIFLTWFVESDIRHIGIVFSYESSRVAYESCMESGGVSKHYDHYDAIKRTMLVSKPDYLNILVWVETHYMKKTRYNYWSYWNFIPVLKWFPVPGNGLNCVELIAVPFIQCGLLDVKPHRILPHQLIESLQEKGLFDDKFIV